jgi:hypothetical protein
MGSKFQHNKKYINGPVKTQHSITRYNMPLLLRCFVTISNPSQFPTEIGDEVLSFNEAIDKIKLQGV